MFRIADLTFESPFILAPLAGYSDLPFRLLCRRYGAAYCVSEMISCHGLTYRQKKTNSGYGSRRIRMNINFNKYHFLILLLIFGWLGGSAQNPQSKYLDSKIEERAIDQAEDPLRSVG